MKIFRFHKSFNSVVIGLVESGNFIPPEIAATMTQQAIDYRSAGQHLLRLCQCRHLRDAGLMATNVSPLVVDLTQPLPKSPSDSNIASLYHYRTPDEQGVYKQAGHHLGAQDHELRRNTFFVPFFQKLNSELDRLVAEFGRATLLMINGDHQLPAGTISLAGDISTHDLPLATQTAKENQIDFIVASRTRRPFIDQRVPGDRVKACSVSISPESLFDHSDWSDKKADQIREFIAAVVDDLSAESK